MTKQAPTGKCSHVVAKHGQSFLTGQPVTFFETEAQQERFSIIRRMLGWPAKSATIYPGIEQCEGSTHEAQG